MVLGFLRWHSAVSLALALALSLAAVAGISSDWLWREGSVRILRPVDVPHRTLHLPCCSLRRIGVNTRGNRRVISFRRTRTHRNGFRDCRGSLGHRKFAQGPITLQDFFGSDFSTAVEERRIG